MAQVVARYLGVVEAVGSSPVTPTDAKLANRKVCELFCVRIGVCPLVVHYKAGRLDRNCLLSY